MQKTLLLLGLLGYLSPFGLQAQQDPMLTQFTFNNLLFNPACAGTNDHLSMSVTHRQQWLGLNGAPVGQSLSVHSPLANNRIALGGTLTHDKIGPTETFDLSTAYAYRFPIGEHMQLSAGLQASLANWHGDWFDILLEDGIDGVFQQNQSRWLPNVGVGLFLYSDRFYAGISSPRIVEHDLRRAAGGDYAFYAKTYRHYYTTVGATFPVADNGRILIKPALLLKSTGWFSSFRRDETFQNIGSPTELDLDCSVFFNQTLRVGASWRTAVEMKRSSASSANVWAMYYLLNGLRFGAAYDLTLSQLRQAATNSLEIVVGYEFDIKVKKVSSPRYF
jgi:type IX secretion system PorP/SprF family membrane protein